MFNLDHFYLENNNSLLQKTLTHFIDKSDVQNIIQVMTLYKNVDKIETVKNCFSEYFTNKYEESNNVLDLVNLNKKKSLMISFLENYQDVKKSLELSFINKLNANPKMSPEILAKSFDIEIKKQGLSTYLEDL